MSFSRRTAIPEVVNSTGVPALTILSGVYNQAASKLLIVAVKWEGSTHATCSLADIAGNTFVPLTRKSATSDFDVQLFYVLSCAGSAVNNITATFSANATFMGIKVYNYDFSGATPIFVAEANGAGNSNSPVSGSFAAGTMGVYIFGDFSGGLTVTPDAGWGTADEMDDTSIGCHATDRIDAPGGSITAGGAMSGGTSVEYAIVAASFSDAGPAATTEQEGFRARNDDGSETTATFAAAQDANLTFALDTNLRLRELINSTNDVASTAFRLDYKLSTDSTYVPVLVSAPAIPTFQAAGTAVTGTAAVSPVWPTHAVGDIALLFVESCGGEPATLTTAAGFVAVTNSPQATGATTTGTQITVFWARATSTSMATPTVGDPGDHVYAQILTFRGCIAEGNPWNITGGGVKAAASTTVSATGVTTTVNNCLLVYAIARDNDSAAAAFSAQADANLASITEQVDAGTVSGNGGGFTVTTGTLATAGASGTMTATVTSSINAWLTIALRPQTTPIMMSTSANITGGGEATTAQLTAPSGKTTSSFTTGRMWDDENGTDSIDIAADFYTELEWCIKALSAQGATNGQVYNFRVTKAGVALDTYSVTFAWTLGTGGVAPRSNLLLLGCS